MIVCYFSCAQLTLVLYFICTCLFYFCSFFLFFFSLYVYFSIFFFFFFSSRRRHTRYIGDWSSDVCSSDLDDAVVVVARQRPATANGIVFLLLEDETGMVNGIVRPEIYERYRSVVRAEPMLVAWGRLERRERVTNVLVDRLARVEPPKAPAEREEA